MVFTEIVFEVHVISLEVFYEVFSTKFYTKIVFFLEKVVGTI